MIGFDFKECKDWNEFFYLTHFFDYAFSTYGIIQRNSSIFIKNIDPEKRWQLFLKPGFIVNIFDCLMPRQEFHNKNHGNSNYQINDSFASETKTLAKHFFKVISLLQIIRLGNQINIYFNSIQLKS